jgi:hypothetical protein
MIPPPPERIVGEDEDYYNGRLLTWLDHNKQAIYEAVKDSERPGWEKFEKGRLMKEDKS